MNDNDSERMFGRLDDLIAAVDRLAAAQEKEADATAEFDRASKARHEWNVRLYEPTHAAFVVNCAERAVIRGIDPETAIRHAQKLWDGLRTCGFVKESADVNEERRAHERALVDALWVGGGG